MGQERVISDRMASHFMIIGLFDHQDHAKWIGLIELDHFLIVARTAIFEIDRFVTPTTFAVCETRGLALDTSGLAGGAHSGAGGLEGTTERKTEEKDEIDRDS